VSNLRILALILAVTVLSACGKEIAVATTTLPDAQVGVPYSQQLQGQNVDRWVLLTGVLPPGLQLSPDGMLVGVPSITGVFVFTVQALQQPSSAPTVSVDLGLSLIVR
jgi:hypothetical protein